MKKIPKKRHTKRQSGAISRLKAGTTNKVKALLKRLGL